ncbi:MAG: HEAT repeat domain-containing protein [Akkermansiaceae bacterium]
MLKRLLTLISNKKEQADHSPLDMKARATTKVKMNHGVFEFTSENTNTKKLPNDNLAHHLLRCTLAFINHPQDSHLNNQVEHALINLNSNEWVSLDSEYRKAASAFIRWETKDFFLDKLKSINSINLTQVLTMWPNGYVREEATRLLGQAPSGHNIPFLLLRLNDWTEPVYLTAKESLLTTLESAQKSQIIEYLPLLIRLKLCRRHLTEKSYQNIAQAFRAQLSQTTLLAQLSSSQARAAAELLWDSKPLTIEALYALCNAADPFIKFKTLRDHVPKLEPKSQEALLLSLPRTKWTPAKLERLRLLHNLNSPAIQNEWIQGLTDGSLSVRQHCRFYLKRLSFTIEKHYINRFRNSSPTAQKHALYGLVEIRSDQASSYLKQWLESNNPIRIAAALNLIDSNLAQKYQSLIVESLQSQIAPLRKAAYIAGLQLNKPESFEPIAWDKTLPIENQRYAAKLIRNSELWYSLLQILKLLHHPDQLIRSSAIHSLEKTAHKFSNSFTRPNKQLATSILLHLDKCQSLVSTQMAKTIKFFTQDRIS